MQRYGNTSSFDRVMRPRRKIIIYISNKTLTAKYRQNR